jgi:hypothetical protein
MINGMSFMMKYTAMKIKNKFDEEEGKLLFWVDGIEGGPVIYADTVEEGEAKVMQLLVDGEVLRRMLIQIKEIKENGKSK